MSTFNTSSLPSASTSTSTSTSISTVEAAPSLSAPPPPCPNVSKRPCPYSRSTGTTAPHFTPPSAPPSLDCNPELNATTSANTSLSPTTPTPYSPAPAPNNLTLPANLIPFAPAYLLRPNGIPLPPSREAVHAAVELMDAVRSSGDLAAHAVANAWWIKFAHVYQAAYTYTWPTYGGFYDASHYAPGYGTERGNYAYAGEYYSTYPGNCYWNAGDYAQAPASTTADTAGKIREHEGKTHKATESHSSSNDCGPSDSSSAGAIDFSAPGPALAPSPNFPTTTTASATTSGFSNSYASANATSATGFTNPWAADVAVYSFGTLYDREAARDREIQASLNTQRYANRDPTANYDTADAYDGYQDHEVDHLSAEKRLQHEYEAGRDGAYSDIYDYDPQSVQEYAEREVDYNEVEYNQDAIYIDHGEGDGTDQDGIYTDQEEEEEDELNLDDLNAALAHAHSLAYEMAHAPSSVLHSGLDSDSDSGSELVDSPSNVSATDDEAEHPIWTHHASANLSPVHGLSSSPIGAQTAIFANDSAYAPSLASPRSPMAILRSPPLAGRLSPVPVVFNSFTTPETFVDVATLGATSSIVAAAKQSFAPSPSGLHSRSTSVSASVSEFILGKRFGPGADLDDLFSTTEAHEHRLNDLTSALDDAHSTLADTAYLVDELRDALADSTAQLELLSASTGARSINARRQFLGLELVQVTNDRGEPPFRSLTEIKSRAQVRKMGDDEVAQWVTYYHGFCPPIGREGMERALCACIGIDYNASLAIPSTQSETEDAEDEAKKDVGDEDEAIKPNSGDELFGANYDAFAASLAPLPPSSSQELTSTPLTPPPASSPLLFAPSDPILDELMYELQASAGTSYTSDPLWPVYPAADIAGDDGGGAVEYDTAPTGIEVNSPTEHQDQVKEQAKDQDQTKAVNDARSVKRTHHPGMIAMPTGMRELEVKDIVTEEAGEEKEAQEEKVEMDEWVEVY